MKFKFSWSQDKRIVGLGPMDGITDSPFRILNKRFGADFVFTEMISADGLVKKSKTIFEHLRFKKGERPIIAQIFGKDPEVMAEAAEILEKRFKFDGIDINCGCSTRKVLSSGHGGALLKDPKRLLSLLHIVRRKTSIPLSVKTRLGYSEPEEIVKLAPKIEKIGINALIIHTRTVKQKFSGRASWNILNQVKKQIKIPLIASGDIFSKEDLAKLFRDTKADGAIVARGALGNPWIFEGLDIIKENPKKYLQIAKTPEEISLREKKEVILEHLNLMIDPPAGGYDEEKACKLFRKFFLWYLKGLVGAKQAKLKAAIIDNLEEAKIVLAQIKE